MKISLNWLKEFVDIDISPEELAELLTLKGLETSDLYDVGRGLEHIIAGKIIRISPHPESNRLYICDTDTGKDIVSIVCSAPNLKTGMIAPLALPGTRLPNGAEVREAEIRGRVSRGVLLAEDELGLTDDHSGIMELPANTIPGTPITSVLPVEDWILDIELTPNRGDCASVLGIAREVAAITNKSIKMPDMSYKEIDTEVDDISSVTIKEPDKCRRYAAGIIRGINIKPSPFWMRYRLYLSEIRPINNIVDITNYVMLEMGQPLHAFDLNRLRGQRIEVRCAREKEIFTTLDGITHELKSEVLLICDAERPVALAGIMGGLNSEISEGTEDVLLEAAFFDPITIRKGAKLLGISTEASYRFERGVDIEGVTKGLKRAIHLMARLADGKVAKGIIDNYPGPYKPLPITMRMDKANSFLGTDIDSSKMITYLNALQMEVKDIDQNRIEVIPPSFRTDITREVDLFEEIARLNGYENIPVTLPYIRPSDKKEEHGLRIEESIKDIMAGMGFTEIISYSFISPEYRELIGIPEDFVKILNPLTKDQSVMRSSLIPGLMEAIKMNINYGEHNLRLFEIGKVFLNKGKGEQPEERPFLVAAISGLYEQKTWYSREREADFYDIKGVAETLLKSLSSKEFLFKRGELAPWYDRNEYAVIYSSGNVIGYIGKISPDVNRNMDIEENIYVMEMDIERLSRYFIEPRKFRPFSRFPALYRDISIVVQKNVESRKIEEIIRETGGDIVESVYLFDLYEGKKIGAFKKALGFRIWFRSMKATLEKGEVDSVYNKIIKRIIDKTGGRLREA